MWAFNLCFSIDANAKYGTFKSVLWYRVFGVQGEWSRRQKRNTTAGGNLVSSVNFIKGPRVSETAIPHFVHHLLCVSLISAGRACPHRENCSPAYTLLMLLGELPLASAEELSRPSAFAAQGAGSDLERVKQSAVDRNDGDTTNSQINGIPLYKQHVAGCPSS
jgi:hypothetical protein